MSFFSNIIFNRVAKSLDGYKTKIGGVGLGLLAIVGMIGHYWPESNCPPMEVDKSLEMLAASFTILGLGSKVQKIVEK
jgi:hypothetical protein